MGLHFMLKQNCLNIYDLYRKKPPENKELIQKLEADSNKLLEVLEKELGLSEIMIGGIQIMGVKLHKNVRDFHETVNPI